MKFPPLIWFQVCHSTNDRVLENMTPGYVMKSDTFATEQSYSVGIDEHRKFGCGEYW